MSSAAAQRASTKAPSHKISRWTQPNPWTTLLRYCQGCTPKKEVGGRLKQDLDEDLQLHRTLILLY